MPIDWVTILSDNLDEKLVSAKIDSGFYVTSYMAYLLASRTTDCPILYNKRSTQDENAWPYVVYPQLVKKKLPLQSVVYMVVNNGFIFSIIRFI